MTLLTLLTSQFESLTVTPTVLLFRFIFSDANIYPPLGNSDHVIVAVSIDFLSNSKGYVSFHRIAYEYYHTDWDSLRDYLRGFPCPCFCCCYWILLVGIDFIRLELLIISVIVNISSSLTHFHGFQLLVLPELIEIAIFVCTNNTFCESKVKFRQQVIVAKAFL